MAYTTPRDWTAGETLTAALMDEQLKDNLLAAFPPGKLEFFVRAATTTETLIGGGWLECNGVAVSRTTYADLNTVLSALSYPFGNGNGTTTFNLPDLQGRALVAMASGGHANVNGLGDSDGLAKTSRSWFHGHSFSLSTSPHSHSFTAVTTGGGATPGGTGATTPASTSTSSESPGVVGSVGQNGTTDVVPYVVCGVWAIKT
jgi:microcystin-dependent protein